MADPGEWIDPEEEPENPQVPSIRAEFFGGPLPAPEILAGFEEAVPGAGDRIMKMAESQLAHSQGLESNRLAAEISLSHKAQALQSQDESRTVKAAVLTMALLAAVGLILGLAVIVGSIYLIHEGKSLEGFAAMLTGLASLVWGGVWSLRKIQEKANQLEPVKRTESESSEVATAS